MNYIFSAELILDQSDGPIDRWTVTGVGHEVGARSNQQSHPSHHAFVEGWGKELGGLDWCRFMDA